MKKHNDDDRVFKIVFRTNVYIYIYIERLRK